MKRARKSNRVSWAPGLNLCQVKLFLSEDCPSKVGQNSHDHLQAKTSSILHSSTNDSYDLPPGFEGNHFLNRSKDELSHISEIKWKTPPLFVPNYNWRVADGEESREKQDQKLREMRVLEAVYPRPSAIPPSPSVSLGIEEEDYDDNLTPLIPIIPIEEEEPMDFDSELPATTSTSATARPQSLHQYVSATNTHLSPQPITPSTVASPGTLGLEADLAAASAVVAAIMKNNEQGSMIDMDLLVKLLNDPLMIEKLVSDHNKSAATTLSASSNAVGIPTPAVSLSPLGHDQPTSGINKGSVGSLPDSGLKPATSSFPSLHTLDRPSMPSLPLSRPGSSVPLPSHTSTPDMLRPTNKNTSHLSNGGLPLSSQPPEQDTVLASGVKRGAPLATISSNEPGTVPIPSTSMNLHAVPHQVRPPASTMGYRPSKGSTFAGKEAHPVKDLSYYKNLIRQHGADDNTQEPQIGIRQSNFKDSKSVYDIKLGEANFKIQKPCIYFKSPRGCRNGSNCPFQHDLSSQWGSVNVLGAQNAKRVKLGPEIKGRT